MNITWNINDNEITRLRNFIAQHDNAFVARRRARNLNRQNIQLDRNTVLKSIAMCLLTTQQRSGPNTPVSIFLRLNPFPFSIENLLIQTDIEAFVRATLIQNNLNRYINKISKFYTANFNILQESKWEVMDDITHTLSGQVDRQIERAKVNDLQDAFSGNGFGPKQSRNLLQAMGLTKYEIPIDSRIINWLNNFGFPITLSSKGLQDKYYYNFVSDGIQNLCDKAEIFPCILDAAIFSSYDNGQWTEENALY